MPMNKISILDNTITFEGFELLKNRMTFCIYPSGIAIVPGWQPSDNPCYYRCEMINREVEDEHLVQLLKQRGLMHGEVFVRAGNHYLELTPHKKVLTLKKHTKKEEIKFPLFVIIYF